MFQPMFVAQGGPEGSGAILPDDIYSVFYRSGAMSKDELELVQFNEYKRLITVHWPDQAFEIINRKDPPDFTVERDNSIIGIDMAALFDTARKQASSEFWHIKQRLLNAYRSGRLRQCKNLRISIDFSTQKVPLARKIEDAIAEFINILETLEINEKTLEIWLRSMDSSQPAPFPLHAMGKTSCGTICWMVEGNVSILNDFKQSNFLRECQFELIHSYKENILPSQLEELFNRVIASHDKNQEQGIDELVIIAGGPDKFGDALTSEAFLVDLFSEWKSKIKEPRYIKRVVLLDWARGSLRVLHGALGWRQVGSTTLDPRWEFSPLLSNFHNKL